MVQIVPEGFTLVKLGAMPMLFAKARRTFLYGGDVRACVLDISGRADWVDEAKEMVADSLHEWFDIVTVQGYKNGNAATDWHTDKQFNDQAILSLGATRVFGLRNVETRSVYQFPMEEGDLLFMPAATRDLWEHAVPAMPTLEAERVSLVFRR